MLETESCFVWLCVASHMNITGGKFGQKTLELRISITAIKPCADIHAKQDTLELFNFGEKNSLMAKVLYFWLNYVVEFLLHEKRSWVSAFAFIRPFSVLYAHIYLWNFLCFQVSGSTGAPGWRNISTHRTSHRCTAPSWCLTWTTSEATSSFALWQSRARWAVQEITVLGVCTTQPNMFETYWCYQPDMRAEP